MRVAILLSLIGVFFFVSGCSERGVKVVEDRRAPLQVISLDKSALRKMRGVVLKPIQYGPNGRKLAPRSEALEKRFSELAVGTLGIEVSPEQLSPTSENPALEANVLHYTERQGSSVAADIPATVQIHYKLLSSATTPPIWEASYSYRDQALTDDLFAAPSRISHDGGARGWRDAYNLVEESMEEALRALEDAREESFLTQSGIEEK